MKNATIAVQHVTKQKLQCNNFTAKIAPIALYQFTMQQSKKQKIQGNNTTAIIALYTLHRVLDSALQIYSTHI